MKKYFISDFGQTMFDTGPAIIAYLNERWGINSKPSDFLENNNLHKIVQKYLWNPEITSEDVYEDYKENFASSFILHKNIKPMEGMTEVAFELCKKYEFVIAAVRTEESHGVIKKLLYEHMPRCVNRIRHILVYDNSKNYEILKEEFISDFKNKTVGFIDNSPREILAMGDIVRSYLFDPAGNYDDFSRVKNWEQIGHLFL